jgi:hypothetical protein
MAPEWSNTGRLRMPIRGSRLVSGGQAASFPRALALIIAAPFSAIMIVGALVFVELTAGITEASTTRSASSPWLRRCARD